MLFQEVAQNEARTNILHAKEPLFTRKKMKALYPDD